MSPCSRRADRHRKTGCVPSRRFSQSAAIANKLRLALWCWISPPDSSHFSKRVQSTVKNLISAAARRDGFEAIPSRTHYVPGKTGRDGVHYNPEASEEWAREVIVRIKRKLLQSEIYAGR